MSERKYSPSRPHHPRHADAQEGTEREELMCHENTEDPGQPHPDPNLNITLSPIATHGQDALATCGIKEIQQIKASKVQFLEHNTGHLLTTKQATDIFAAPSTGPDRPRPIPKSAILTEANLDITVAGVSDPIQVQLVPPNTIRISNPAKTPLILAWLTKSLFNAASALGHLALVLALAIATAAAPAFDDNDGDTDDDDGDSERPHLAFH